MPDQSEQSITLRLDGARAQGGVSLPDFEKFIEQFLAALRDFDRSRRGEITKKSGHPEARAQAVTAFRLVAFRKGSGIATIEPDLQTLDADTDQMVEVEPIQIENLNALLTRVEAESGLPAPVTDALEMARRSVGEDGFLEVEIRTSNGDDDTPRRVSIDGDRISRIRSNEVVPEPRVVTSISGRLHQVDFEPDKLAIRTSDGVDWACKFPAELEGQVEKLVNRIVWVSGSGSLQSPRKGSMALDLIKPVEDGTQTQLFSIARVPNEVLESEQGISEPQGLEAIGTAQWTDEDEAYLKALTD